MQQKEGCTGHSDKTNKTDTSLKSIIFPPNFSEQDRITEFTEIYQMIECQICAPLPCHLSCCIFSKAILCGSWVTAAVVGVCQEKAVDYIFCSNPPARPSTLCHYWGASRDWRKKKFSKNNFLLYSMSLAVAVFQQVHPANAVRVCQWWCVMIGQSVVGCHSVVRICVWPVVI